jgi:hypothetical protein
LLCPHAQLYHFPAIERSSLFADAGNQVAGAPEKRKLIVMMI